MDSSIDLSISISGVKYWRIYHASRNEIYINNERVLTDERSLDKANGIWRDVMWLDETNPRWWRLMADDDGWCLQNSTFGMMLMELLVSNLLSK